MPNIKVEQTLDYEQFVVLKGNRRVDPKQVARLAKKMALEGNLTEIFPIIVNEKMEVIDGQHRLTALKQLEWPVFYETKKGLTIDTVQALNTGTKNWSWFDYAWSFSQQGNENYTRFLNLWDHFNLPFTLLLYYTSGNRDSGRRNSSFHNGEFEFKDQKKSFDLLSQYVEVAEAAAHSTGKFAQAMYDIMQLPEYDHKRMVDKMSKYGGELKGYTNKLDYMRAIEDVYNTYVGEASRVRLF